MQFQGVVSIKKEYKAGKRKEEEKKNQEEGEGRKEGWMERMKGNNTSHPVTSPAPAKGPSSQRASVCFPLTGKVLSQTSTQT